MNIYVNQTMNIYGKSYQPSNKHRLLSLGAAARVHKMSSLDASAQSVNLNAVQF